MFNTELKSHVFRPANDKGNVVDAFGMKFSCNEVLIS